MPIKTSGGVMIGAIYKRIIFCWASTQKKDYCIQKEKTCVKFDHNMVCQTNITENDEFYFVLRNICKDLLDIVVIFDFI